MDDTPETHAESLDDHDFVELGEVSTGTKGNIAGSAYDGFDGYWG